MLLIVVHDMFTDTTEYILEEYEKCKSLLEEEKNKKLDFNENKQNKNILMILFTISMSIGLFIKKFV